MLKSKLFKKALFTILCLPILPIIGIPDGDGTGGATGGTGGESGTGSGAGADGAGDDGGSGGDQTPNSGEKLPKTLEELQSLMKKEKNSGRNAMIKELFKDLNIDDPKNAKEAVAAYKKYLDEQKTAEQRLSDDLTAAKTTLTAAEQRAQKAEQQLSLIKLGCKADSVEDALALITVKVTDDKSFETVVKEIKTKYPMFFTEGTGDNGTGGTPNGKKVSGASTGLGARLATATAKPKQNPYFSK